MISTPAISPATGLTPPWQDWLTGNLVAGAPDGELLTAMCDAGFDRGFAQAAITVVRAMTERVRQMSPQVLGDYQADPIRLPADSRVQAADREVSIGFVLENPNVALLQGVLSVAECEKLVQLASDRLRRSEVVDRNTGGTGVDGARTSEGMFFTRGENAIVDRLEKRLSALLSIPVDHGEGLQVLRYGPGAEYLPHHDYFDPAEAGTPTLLVPGGQRVATVVVYLNDVPAGGETVFPELELAVKPHRGDAVYFEYCNVAGQLDQRCLHAGAPVLRGEKWVATKWLRQSANVMPAVPATGAPT